MMKCVVITIPFPGAAQHAAAWAQEERHIDFRRDPDRAARCTLAFAATELKCYLSRTLEETQIQIDHEVSPGAFHLHLELAGDIEQPDGFRLRSTDGGLRIGGQSRAGVLYGAYELLRLQGWRWYAPGAIGEVAPPARKTLALPSQAVQAGPSLPLGRGFDFEGVSKESAELLLWMARNRLNLCGCRANTAALARKLGMIVYFGGHIFETMLAPDRPLASGRTLWEEHPEWYGLPATGQHIKDQALRTQFCVCQPDLLRFLADELLALLNGEWREADRVAVWGFDTWGSTCRCQACQALGNSSDATIHFLTQLRRILNQFRGDGRLDHDVSLSMCAYEGTDTLPPPSRPVSQELLAAGDSVTFYPINRCYCHDLGDPQCPTNARYQQALRGWLQPQTLPLTIGEYYNVSRFEDLPLLFAERMVRDIPACASLGAGGITYMHVPLVNWAMRALTHSLYAQLAWDTTADVQAFMDDYFDGYYGPHAGTMRTAYEHIERAWQMISQWRAWAGESILSLLAQWDGRRPAQPLSVDGHFAGVSDAIAQGRRAVWELEKAMALLHCTQAAERNRPSAKLPALAGVAVNPIEAEQRARASAYTMRLGDDRRLLRYGLDTMRLMSDLAAYHEALRCDHEEEADAIWRRVESTADQLDSYYIPMTYLMDGAGFVAKDGLTRSQLRTTVDRCRHAWRMAHCPSVEKPALAAVPARE